MNAKPKINDGTKIKVGVICEGAEEAEYLQRLIDLSVWSLNLYTFIIENAKGINNLLPLFQAKFQIATYDVLLIFCDTETEPYQDFKKLKNQIDRMHGKKLSDKVIIFANPCSMQIILKHFDDIRLSEANKSKNEATIQRLTGISEYRATAHQRKQLFSKINKENYDDMKIRIAKLSKDFAEIGASNFTDWITYFEKIKSES